MNGISEVPLLNLVRTVSDILISFSPPLLQAYDEISLIPNSYVPTVNTAVPSGRGVKGVGLRLLAVWDCGFESRWG
jgi:hypothetical protein